MMDDYGNDLQADWQAMRREDEERELGMLLLQVLTSSARPPAEDEAEEVTV